jgi:hypothetical protein
MFILRTPHQDVQYGTRCRYQTTACKCMVPILITGGREVIDVPTRFLLYDGDLVEMDVGETYRETCSCFLLHLLL